VLGKYKHFVAIMCNVVRKKVCQPVSVILDVS
jgi:hypothetical protein